jgi:SAM-dependent methyltransferase
VNYEDIFRERGGAYHRAMRDWPDARREEFMIPVGLARVTTGDVVVDVPAGGGYLQRYLPTGTHWHGHEPCASFQDNATAADSGLLPLPWPSGFADAALSVAGVHHLVDKRPLFREVHRALKPGGRFVLADAWEESAAARFLDEFVGSYNSTGHSGIYVTARTLAELVESGFDVQRAERTSYCWWFADRLSMGAFCRLLFDMRGIDDATVADAIETRLGVTVRGSECGMNWELMIAVAVARG